MLVASAIAPATVATRDFAEPHALNGVPMDVLPQHVTRVIADAHLVFQDIAANSARIDVQRIVLMAPRPM